MKTTKSLVLASFFTLLCGSLFAQLDWVPFEGELPGNAVIGGVESHRSLAVCRADFQGAKHPGKVVDGACNIGYGGAEKMVPEFDVLVNNGGIELDWLKSSGTMPDHAIKAGTERGLDLYVGRAFHENGTHPGKIFKSGSNNICNIGYGGKEITFSTFEVLVENPPHESSSLLEITEYCADSSAVKVGSIGTMSKNQKMNEGVSLISSNLRYQTRVSDDGRLVVEEVLEHGLCEDGTIFVFAANELWSNTPNGGDPNLDYYLTFQDDGNLCIYSEQNGFVWCSMSHGDDSDHFEITNIGHIEVVNSHGGEVWPD